MLGTSTSVTDIPSLVSISAVIIIISLSAVGLALYYLVVHTRDCLPLNTDIPLTYQLFFYVSNIISSQAFILSDVFISMESIGPKQSCL